jgi:hypothetical protein
MMRTCGGGIRGRDCRCATATVATCGARGGMCLLLLLLLRRWAVSTTHAASRGTVGRMVMGRAGGAVGGTL